MKNHEKFIENANLKDATHLEVSVFYDKGGYNYFNSQSSPRGYYLSVKPVTKGNGMIRFNIFGGGRKRLLLETKRYSDKQFQQAIELSKDWEDEMIALVIENCKAA